MRSQFQITQRAALANGITIQHIFFPSGLAHGRSATIILDRVQLELFVFYELVNRSFNSQWGYSLPPTVSSGVNLPQFFQGNKPELGRIEHEIFEKCLIACNTVHTNFVRGNGFVITQDGTLVHKPNGAVALDGTSYIPLSGAYTALVIADNGPRVDDLLIHNNQLVQPVASSIVISGPRIVEASVNVTQLVHMRSKNFGQTIGNEINYSPTETRTSFTAFGMNKENELIVVSMFAGDTWEEDDALNCRFFKAKRNIEGITLSEMADLLIELGATDAIVGGGAADTQQYVMKDRIWAGEPSGTNRDPEVLGLRGLGAILGVLPPNV